MHLCILSSALHIEMDQQLNYCTKSVFPSHLVTQSFFVCFSSYNNIEHNFVLVPIMHSFMKVVSLNVYRLCLNTTFIFFQHKENIYFSKPHTIEENFCFMNIVWFIGNSKISPCRGVVINMKNVFRKKTLLENFFSMNQLRFLLLLLLMSSFFNFIQRFGRCKLINKNKIPS